MLKKLAKGLLAGITSPEAIKAEKSLAVIIVVRLLIAAGASAELVQIVQKAVS